VLLLLVVFGAQFRVARDCRMLLVQGRLLPSLKLRLLLLHH